MDFEVFEERSLCCCKADRGCCLSWILAKAIWPCCVLREGEARSDDEDEEEEGLGRLDPDGFELEIDFDAICDSFLDESRWWFVGDVNGLSKLS